jgi:hypothetical protein
MAIDKNTLVSDVTSWMPVSRTGYFITLNARTKEWVCFEQDLKKIAHNLNHFIYGRAYERQEKTLKIIGGIETGKVDGILHAHLIVALQGETNRKLPDVNMYIRKHWYKLIGLHDHNGSMVDVQDIGNPEERISYISKDTDYWLRNDKHNLFMI